MEDKIKGREYCASITLAACNQIEIVKNWEV